jgi:hypothetical protein
VPRASAAGRGTAAGTSGLGVMQPSPHVGHLRRRHGLLAAWGIPRRPHPFGGGGRQRFLATCQKQRSFVGLESLMTVHWASCSTDPSAADPRSLRGGGSRNIRHSSSSETAAMAGGYGLPEAGFPTGGLLDLRLLARRLAHNPNPPNAEDLRGLRSAAPQYRQPGRSPLAGLDHAWFAAGDGHMAR